MCIRDSLKPLHQHLSPYGSHRAVLARINKEGIAGRKCAGSVGNAVRINAVAGKRSIPEIKAPLDVYKRQVTIVSAGRRKKDEPAFTCS